jgi:hypothetical protein
LWKIKHPIDHENLVLKEENAAIWLLQQCNDSKASKAELVVFYIVEFVNDFSFLKVKSTILFFKGSFL